MKQTKQYSLLDFEFPDTSRAEKQVIVDVTMNPSAMPEVMEIVTPELFSLDITRTAWELMVSMYNAGEPIDLFSVRMKVGSVFKEEILPAVPEPAGGEMSSITHARVLRDGAARRNAYNSACWLLEKSTKPGITEEEIVVAANKISERFHSVTRGSEKSMAEVMNLVQDDIKARAEAARMGKSLSVPTGIPRLDKELCGGFEPGQLIILAARPSVGKTALMLQLARNAAVSGFPSMIFSLEMTETQLGSRLLVSTGEVTREEMKAGGTSDGFWHRFANAYSYIQSLPITIKSDTTLVPEIISKLTIAVQNGCKVGFIDYLGLMKGVSSLKDMTKAQMVGEITKAIKTAAMRLGIPIVLLSQLNREKDKGSKREPQLTDLRDSGDIEQDADVVIMLDQELKVVGTDVGAEERQILVMYVRKNREGVRDFRIDLIPNDSYTQFTEYVTPNF